MDVYFGFKWLFLALQNQHRKSAPEMKKERKGEI